MASYRGSRRKPGPVVKPGILVVAGVLLSLICTIALAFTLGGRGDEPSASADQTTGADVGIVPGPGSGETTGEDPTSDPGTSGTSAGVTSTAGTSAATSGTSAGVTSTTGSSAAISGTSQTKSSSTQGATSGTGSAQGTSTAGTSGTTGDDEGDSGSAGTTDGDDEATGGSSYGSKKPPSGDASWIKISSAGINRPVVPQGLSANGTISPNVPYQVIWYTGNDRVAPGKVGTSVIAAHVTWEGTPDAFYNLEGVHVGDTVEVGYSGGGSRTFKVTEARPVDKVELSKSDQVWGHNASSRRLALITCDPTHGFRNDGHSKYNFMVVAEG